MTVWVKKNFVLHHKEMLSGSNIYNATIIGLQHLSDSSSCYCIRYTCLLKTPSCRCYIRDSFEILLKSCFETLISSAFVDTVYREKFALILFSLLLTSVLWAESKLVEFKTGQFNHTSLYWMKIRILNQYDQLHGI